MKIITIFDDNNECLSQKAAKITLNEEGLKEAENIADKLIETIIPLMPAAGLAAPQIGISRQVFIFSWDRTFQNLEVVINPKVIWFDPQTNTSFETCFSTIQENGISKAAKVKRANSLIAEYFNLKGGLIKRKLEGFAAKVFQHEYEHLQGIENIKKTEAEIKNFATKAELIEFMRSIKNEDSINYTKPSEI